MYIYINLYTYHTYTETLRIMMRIFCVRKTVMFSYNIYLHCAMARYFDRSVYEIMIGGEKNQTPVKKKTPLHDKE